MLRWAVVLSLLLSCCEVESQTHCSNGGTFDYVSYRCICTPEFYGRTCETAFASSDPCSNASIPEITDSTASHAPGNTQSCSSTGGCINFYNMATGWYRLRSPAGGFLTSTCPNTTVSCGSADPYILTDIVQEANANRQLFSAKLFRASGPGPVCYNSAETSYPVRILYCGSFNLYYLEPTMSSSHHFCIGNRKACSGGLVSADGSGYEPCVNASACLPRVKSGADVLPVLSQAKSASSEPHFDRFNCAIRDAFSTNSTLGLLYRVKYRITFHNSTQVVILGCTIDDLSVVPGNRVIASCPYEKMLMPHSNIYSATLECTLQAKCNSSAEDYISQELVSASHRLLFQLVEPSSLVLTTSNPIQLCINISKVPIVGEVTLRVSARQTAAVPNEALKVEIKAAQFGQSKSGIDALSVTLNATNRHPVICLELRLLISNQAAALTVNGTQIEVSAGFNSTASSSGVYTAGKLVTFMSLKLMADGSALNMRSTTTTMSSRFLTITLSSTPGLVLKPYENLSIVLGSAILLRLCLRT
ncbi:hypothetical protein BOX15_Mlig006017g1 [Macrostomum lignano]|uniref:EGF-like domain-containing protein n=1 Tax=Macrostomum lignano TaxID=282301 RepID=A0A267EWY6_9PLAT|nr:hypothetical protein BOX15_Mlig006017g1 [Macrostomum lignano]